MIDIKFLRENPEVVKENIKKKFQDEKLPLVDEVIELDSEIRKAKQEGDELKSKKNSISKEISGLMERAKKAEAAGDRPPGCSGKNASHAGTAAGKGASLHLPACKSV